MCKLLLHLVIYSQNHWISVFFRWHYVLREKLSHRYYFYSFRWIKAIIICASKIEKHGFVTKWKKKLSVLINASDLDFWYVNYILNCYQVIFHRHWHSELMLKKFQFFLYSFVPSDFDQNWYFFCNGLISNWKKSSRICIHFK